MMCAVENLHVRLPLRLQLDPITLLLIITPYLLYEALINLLSTSSFHC
jgi:hypothetical protein